MKKIIKPYSAFIAFFVMISAINVAFAQIEDPNLNETQATTIISNFEKYAPVYFIAGLKPNDAKFQLSFKYKVFGTPQENIIKKSGFYLAYTQTSLWDLEGESKPFKDSSYKPEIFYQFALNSKTLKSLGGSSGQWNLQAGAQHESNGRSGDNSRSLNNIYLQLAFEKEFTKDLFFSLNGRAIIIAGDLEGNPDIQNYRGRSLLNLTTGYKNGLQLEAQLMGSLKTGKGSLELDFSLPANPIGINLNLHAQLFTGYGESLLGYNQKNTRLRVGISLLR